MKTKLSLLILTVLFTFSLRAQDVTVDEILNNYYENTGGRENWAELEGIKILAKVNQGGMEIPLEIVQLADGRQYTKITFQGKEIKQGVFDGDIVWSTNFQTMTPEKADEETSYNQKLNANDFPDEFFNYKDKGYAIELLGKETIEGTETYKIKLTKEPVKIDGEEVADVTYHYFDTENFVPIAQESEVKQGPQKGIISQVTLSDYQEVDGYYFPFSMTQGVKDGPSQPLNIDSIEVNPEVSDEEFKFPAADETSGDN